MSVGSKELSFIICCFVLLGRSAARVIAANISFVAATSWSSAVKPGNWAFSSTNPIDALLRNDFVLGMYTRCVRYPSRIGPK